MPANAVFGSFRSPFDPDQGMSAPAPYGWQGDDDPGLADLIEAILDNDPDPSPSSVRAATRQLVEHEISDIIDQLAGLDAFDAIESIWQREAFRPADDADVTEPPFPAALLAAMLVSRPSRRPTAPASTDALTGADRGNFAQDMREQLSDLAFLSVARLLAEQSVSADPLADLAAAYRIREMAIGPEHYRSIDGDFDQALLSDPAVASLLRRHLGYTYPDLLVVRAAVADGSPGKRELSAAEIARDCDLPEPTVRAVLDSFSLTFGSTTKPGAAVFSLLMQGSPSLTAQLIADGAGTYVPMAPSITLSPVRELLEKALPSGSSDHAQYCEIRREVCHRQASQYMERILTRPASLSRLEYFHPRLVDGVFSLTRDCADPAAIASPIFGGALFEVDNVAFILQVHDEPMAPKAQRGNVGRLTAELDRTLGAACFDAWLLQLAIEHNHGVWLAAGTWLDLAHIEEVRMVIVTLDDLRLIATALEDLQQANVVPELHPPHVTCLHDLAVISEICDHPAEFLLYLRRREDPDLVDDYGRLPELELYLLFRHTGFDPSIDLADVWRRYPASRNGHVDLKDDHELADAIVQQARLILDEHMQDLQLGHDDAPTLPGFGPGEGVAPVIDAMTESGQDGWLRSSTVLFGLREDMREKHLAQLVAELQHDGSSEV